VFSNFILLYKGIDLEQQDMNKRLLIAIVLSVVVLVGSSYLFPSKPKQVTQANNTTTQTLQESAKASAPTAPVSTVKDAPTATKVSNITQTRATADSEGTLITVKAEKFVIKIDTLGRIYSTVLLEDKYRDENGKQLELIDPKRTMPLEIRFKDIALNTKAFHTDYKASSNEIVLNTNPQSVTMTQDLGLITVTKKLTFYPDGHYDLSVELSKPTEYFITSGHRIEADKSMYMIVRGVLVRDNQGIITTIEDGDMKESITINNATIVSSFDRYYASLFYNFKSPFGVIVTNDNSDPLPFVHSSNNITLNGYIGPKEWEKFESLDPRLTDAIEFGWFTFLAKPFFKVMLVIYNFVGNWGWAIVLFTLLVKIVLFPLSYKGMMSMQKLKDLAPRMKDIKEKYGDDPVKMNQQMMELYKKHGANPMGGCLPMLLQIPVFFALYRVLLNADELQGADWILWITDLSKQDPYFVLPILMGATMFLQQKITPTSITDPMQEKIFKWFPVLMTFFFLTFPAGLVLYWLTNNILSIAQQYYINHAYEKYKARIKEAKKSGTGA